jgi:DNA-binding MarR family transcriptional regulator
MKIEAEIRQKEFRNEYQKAAINLVFTNNWLMAKHQNFFTHYGITHKQYNVLRILKGQYPNSISTSDIRDRMLDKSSDSSRIVDRLAGRDLVIKRVCPSDKRLVDVSITDRGLNLLNTIDSNIQELDRFTASLSEDEARQLNVLLDKIRG